MRKPIIVIALISAALLSGCGASNPAALKNEGCDAFKRGTDRLNVDDTAYESFKTAYIAFNKLAKDEAFYVKFGSIAYQLSQRDIIVPWSDIDEVNSYCGNEF